MLVASAPSATVEMTRLADIQRVKLSKMRTCHRVVGKTRSIPWLSMPGSCSGMETISEAIERVLLFCSCVHVSQRTLREFPHHGGPRQGARRRLGVWLVLCVFVYFAAKN